MLEQEPAETEEVASAAEGFVDNAVYCLAELASILKVGRRTAAAIVKAGEIPARKVGRQWRILGESIRDYMGDTRIIRADQPLRR